ncbi:recombinase family protein [Kitasatospora sp. NPDC059803]|uniref:recombinase family protein n=1 Tax=Kitasatospora sp. NPDC059803 TaxID=3346953 RepID=UPI0036571042
MDPVTPYDGCGKCLLGVRRLSRMKDATSSPARQRDEILRAAEAAGGHVIAWSDDWEVSGATDPFTRPALGPWLRGERGPFSGLAASMVDRLGRDTYEGLRLERENRAAGRSLLTADHLGFWDMDDPNQELEFNMKLFGAQIEHRAIRTRNRQEIKRARAAGEPHNKPSYGYKYVRLSPTAKVEHAVLDHGEAERGIPDAAGTLREVKRRILADQTGKITVATEAARLTRAGVLSPNDQLRVNYGREPKGTPWSNKSLKRILCSEAALGYLMHAGKPVLGKDGHPVRIGPALWDRATRDALIEKTAPKRSGKRAPRGVHRQSGLITCGNCANTLVVSGSAGSKGQKWNRTYACTAKFRGIPGAENCKPAPSINMAMADAEMEVWFLARFGPAEYVERVYDPGSGLASRIADLTADRARLRDDRNAGLYDEPDDAEWYRTEYARMGEELKELKATPERPAGWRRVRTGRTVAADWAAAPDEAARREMLESFGVSAVLYPSSVERRYVITANPEPGVLASALDGPGARPQPPSKAA